MASRVLTAKGDNQVHSFTVNTPPQTLNPDNLGFTESRRIFARGFVKQSAVFFLLVHISFLLSVNIDFCFCSDFTRSVTIPHIGQLELLSPCSYLQLIVKFLDPQLQPQADRPHIPNPLSVRLYYNTRLHSDHAKKSTLNHEILMGETN